MGNILGLASLPTVSDDGDWRQAHILTQRVIDYAERHDEAGLAKLLEKHPTKHALLTEQLYQRLAELGCPEGICDVLAVQGHIQAEALARAMRDTNQYSGLPWLLRCPERARAVEYDQDDRRDTASFGSRDTALNLLGEGLRHGAITASFARMNLPHLLRDLGSTTGNLHEGMFLLDCVDPACTAPEVYAEVVMALVDDNVLKAAWPKLKENQLEHRRALQMDYLVLAAMESEGLEYPRFLESVLQSSELLTQTWREYWAMEDTTGDFPLLRIETEEGDREDIGDDAELANDKDFFDLALRWPAAWAVDALLDNTSLGTQLENRLRNGGGTQRLLDGMARGACVAMSHRLASALGADWRDTRGNTLIHAIVLIKGQGEANTRALQSALRVLGNDILDVPNQKGDTALDLMRQSEAWQEKKSFMSQLMRRQLRKHSERRARTPKRTASKL